MIAQVEGHRKAIRGQDVELSYAELEKYVDIMARILQQRYKVCQGHYVAICFEKTAWAVIAMLGIQRAGAAFVPVDRSYPIARVHEILQQVDAKVMLVSREVHAERHDIGRLIKAVAVDEAVLVANPDLQPGVIHSDSNRPAYCFMTSGR